MTPIRLRVKELRVAKGYGIRELARMARVQHQTVLAIEEGTTTRVDLAVMERLADALDVDPSLLVVRVPAKRRK